MQAAGFVLAGGNSSRMGRDKALLPGLFRYVIDDVAEGVRAATGNVTLIGDPYRYQDLGYPCLPDLRPGLGPISGLESALRSTNACLNLVLPCDMPSVKATHLRSLLGRASTSNGNCVVTQDLAGRIHPLCAVYKAECLPVIQCRLDGKRLSLMGLLEELVTECIRVPWTVENINTPEDWAHWSKKDLASIKDPWQPLT
jgi:molybdopterin-guanine dinucleotide biosynthesis protein A